MKLGIDIGAENTKVAIVKNGDVLSLVSVGTGSEQYAAVEKGIKQALEKIGKNKKDMKQIKVTGGGRKAIPDITKEEVSEMSAAAKGALFFFPSCRIVIDVGAEEAKAARIDSEGKIKDFAVNEKCAAGAGSFVGAMAKALEVSVEELAKIALQSEKKIPMNAQCAIFAESEVVSLIHGGFTKADISKAIHDAIADRIAGMARRAGIEKDVVVIGGVAKNIGFIDSLKRALNMDILVCPNPEYVSAIGAAIIE
jgi:benzoyl-CoA reductase subunit D